MSSSGPRFRPASLFRWRDRVRQTQTPSNTRGFRSGVERLEDRRLLSGNYAVNETADSAGGPSDLISRYAITQAIGGGGSLAIGSSSELTNRTESGAVVSSAPRAFYGQSVTLTASFQAAAGAAPMTGTVAFYDVDSLLGTVALSASGTTAAGSVSGTASLATSALSVGQHLIRAVYSGDAHYSRAGTTALVSVQVAPARTITTLTASTTAHGTILTAAVVVTTPGDPPVAGKVFFYDANALIGTAPVANGVARFNAGVLPPGTGSFTAVFLGGGTESASVASLTAPA